jgi:hypothetical protein
MEALYPLQQNKKICSTQIETGKKPNPLPKGFSDRIAATLVKGGHTGSS